MQSTKNSVIFSGDTTPRPLLVAYWTVMTIFCLGMSLGAIYGLLPQSAHLFTRLGFPAGYFRLELSVAKLLGSLALLLPFVPPRIKEWAHAGFAINLVSALMAHAFMNNLTALIPPSLTSVLWALSYFLWCRIQRDGRTPEGRVRRIGSQRLQPEVVSL